MKKSTTTPEMKLIEKFDHQLRDLLMTDLKVIREARIKLINHLSFNTQGRFMTA
ncbi:MAG: hypothetical protein WKF68_05090 [Daejeonella sp.]